MKELQDLVDRMVAASAPENLAKADKAYWQDLQAVIDIVTQMNKLRDRMVPLLNRMERWANSQTATFVEPPQETPDGS